MSKIAFHTLGCKVNQVETEFLKEEFLNKGYEIVDFNELADVYVVNTCTVTHVSDRKSRAMLRRAARRNPEAIVAAVGCTAQVDAEQLAGIEGVNLVVGNRDKHKLADIIEEYNKGMGVKILSAPISSDHKLKRVIYSQRHLRTRAFVKIQDGCQSFCAYCIIPYARGPVRSKIPEDVIKEIKQLVSLGYQEIVLTGIHTGLYGIDIKGWNLARLLTVILEEVPGNYRIRLSSLEPLEVTADIIDLVKKSYCLCRHFHIPLQSGSDKILKSMNRRYTNEYYNNLIKSIDNEIPGVAFTADVMVGFPGEEIIDHEETYKLLDNLPIYDLHVFKYSARPGTRAADFTPQVSEGEKHRRSEELIALAEKKHEAFIRSFIGQQLKVLVEKKIKDNNYMGLSDNYIEILFDSRDECLLGSFVKISITDFNNGRARGELVASTMH